jgi:hypothetical protein
MLEKFLFDILFVFGLICKCTIIIRFCNDILKQNLQLSFAFSGLNIYTWLSQIGKCIVQMILFTETNIKIATQIYLKLFVCRFFTSGMF